MSLDPVAAVVPVVPVVPVDLAEPIVPVIVPAWPEPANVTALFSTRHGGVSTGCWDAGLAGGGLNLGGHCGDDPQKVAINRRRLERAAGFPIRWLNQVHGTRVVEIRDRAPDVTIAGTVEGALPLVPDADAQVTTVAGIGLGVLVADCLAVLLADRTGSVVGAAHAGWRGLAGGVIENTVRAMRLRRPDAEILAWLSPCIGPASFEVGEDVVEAFVSRDARAAAHFVPAAGAGKWWADLAGLATQRLGDEAVFSVSRADACTVKDPDRFWSYRRDRACGRMAAVIGLRR